MSSLIDALKQKDVNQQQILDMIPNSDLSYTDSFGSTALMIACQNKMQNVAIALINTGQSKPEQVDRYRYTALIYACRNKMQDVAIALINTGQSKPEHADRSKYTALIYACMNKLSDVAIALINTGQSNPQKVCDDGNTALIYACSNKMTDVAIALINTGQSNPDHDGSGGDTALIIACEYQLTDVAISLINTAGVDVTRKNRRNQDALYFAKEHNLVSLIELIENNIIIQQRTQQEAINERVSIENNIRNRQRTQQEAINERVRQSAQQHVEIYSPYEECIICSELLDNINGPGQSAKCNENCNDVVKICENNHMIHRGCLLNACNADRVNISSQMGFSGFNTLVEQKKKKSMSDMSSFVISSV